MEKLPHGVGVVSLVAVILLCLTHLGNAQTTTVRVRFVNGRNGKPLRLKSYDRGEIGAGAYTVDKVSGDAMVITFGNVSTFAFRSGAFDPCDVKDKRIAQPKYSVREIVEHGVTAPNYCGKSHLTASPGELIIYSRHQRWWEITGNVARGLLICG
jgi:hypothetical protein